MMSGRHIACWLVVAGLVVVGAGRCATTTSPATRDGHGTDWGPLAVVDEAVTGGGAAGLGPGTLHIGAECVTLRVGGHETTLIWRGPQVAWDSRARVIVFTSSRDRQVRLSDGETILVGGTGDPYPNPK